MCVTVIAVLFSFAAVVLLRGRGNDGRAALFISIMVGIILMMNGFSSVRIAYTRNLQSNNNMPFKTNFVVKKIKNAPNVYWIHCDGMLGFASMKKYFGDSQNEFLQALADRGFAVNKEAMLEAGHTTDIAIPALMSPELYDRWLRSRLSSHEKAMQLRSLKTFDLEKASSKNETIQAFESAGYASHIIGNWDVGYYYPRSNYVYTTSGNTGFSMIRSTVDWMEVCDLIHANEFLGAFIPALSVLQRNCLNLIAKNQDQPTIMKPALAEEELKHIFLHNDGISEYAYMAHALKYTLTGSMPRFAVVFNLVAHSPYYFNEYGKVIADKGNAGSMSYPAQHRYAAKVLVNLTDIILREDPDAVIVLQADHGLHCNTKEEFAEYFRNPDCAIDLWNNIMSAIRVPKRFRNGEESHAVSNPLNMSRYIINRFVGRNYEYTSTQ